MATTATAAANIDVLSFSCSFDAAETIGGSKYFCAGKARAEMLCFRRYG
jgi:hypothetical protein